MTISQEGRKQFTVAEVRRRFEDNGVNLAAWAKENGFKSDELYALLAGRTKGRRGRSYDLAVALGIRVPRKLEQ